MHLAVQNTSNEVYTLFKKAGKVAEPVPAGSDPYSRNIV